MSRREDGAAVVVAIAVLAGLVFVAVLGSAVVALVATHRQVQAAADLAVLAGASALADGNSPCAVVSRIAARNGGRVQSCEADGSLVTAVVERRLPRLFGHRVVRARSRAGPVGAPSSARHSRDLWKGRQDDPVTSGKYQDPNGSGQAW